MFPLVPGQVLESLYVTPAELYTTPYPTNTRHSSDDSE